MAKELSLEQKIARDRPNLERTVKELQRLTAERQQKGGKG